MILPERSFSITIGCYRALALGLSISVLAWQLVNLQQGRFHHGFLVADLVASGFLLIAAYRSSAIHMFAGFAVFVGIFLAATTGKISLIISNPGTVAAGFGLVVSVVGMVGLGRRLSDGR